MANFKKTMMAAAGAGGGGLDVDEVFSTYLYTGTGSTQTFSNGIDLAGEGGLVWMKARNNQQNNWWYDSERSSFAAGLRSDTTANEYNPGTAVTSVSSSGFTLGTYGEINQSTIDYTSWTFRKAPKFFDVVKVTPSSSNTNLRISHSLGATPGCIIAKRSDGSGDWIVWHKGLASATNSSLNLNLTSSVTTRTNTWGTAAPTSTDFGIDTTYFGSSVTYVFYVFADNDGDGGFGLDGDKDIIKCGLATLSNVSPYDVEVDLGFEPQWVLLKDVNHSGSPWWVIDNMRGWSVQKSVGALSSSTGGKWKALFANTLAAEVEYDYGGLTATGFKLPSNFNYVDNNTDYIYIAIRRGPLAVPEDATDVFAADLSPNNNDPRFISGFPVDMAMQRRRTSTGVKGFDITSRLTTQKYMRTGLANAESSTSTQDMDYMNGYDDDGDTSTAFISHMWKRAPGYFDVVTYNGDGVAGRTVSHNLGVVPEMIWVKKRNQNSNWEVYLDSQGGTKRIYLDYGNAIETTSSAWNNTDATDTVFSLGTSSQTNQNGGTFIAYLFGSLAGVSKVGSYTGNGSSQTIDCGFTAGARYVLIKRVNGTGNWLVYDSVRGINVGDDPRMFLNLTDAEVSDTNSINVNASGFSVNNDGNFTNQSGANYIFYAIA